MLEMTAGVGRDASNTGASAVFFVAKNLELCWTREQGSACNGLWFLLFVVRLAGSLDVAVARGEICLETMAVTLGPFPILFWYLGCACVPMLFHYPYLYCPLQFDIYSIISAASRSSICSGNRRPFPVDLICSHSF